MTGFLLLPVPKGRRLIDFEHDFELINSFLLSKYGKNFINALKDFEIDFDSYFEDMSNTTLGEVVSLRQKKKDNVKMTKEEKNAYEKIKLPFNEEEKKEFNKNNQLLQKEQIKISQIINKHKKGGVNK